jgi:hypothetical protein
LKKEVEASKVEKAAEAEKEREKEEKKRKAEEKRRADAEREQVALQQIENDRERKKEATVVWGKAKENYRGEVEKYEGMMSSHLLNKKKHNAVTKEARYIKKKASFERFKKEYFCVLPEVSAALLKTNSMPYRQYLSGGGNGVKPEFNHAVMWLDTAYAREGMMRVFYQNSLRHMARDNRERGLPMVNEYELCFHLFYTSVQHLETYIVLYMCIFIFISISIVRYVHLHKAYIERWLYF